MGYEKAAHLYELFDTKENIEFFLRYGSEAGEGKSPPLLGPLPQGERKTQARRWRVCETNVDASK